jgi:hypothetical protein
MPLILLSFLEVRGNPSLSATSQNVHLCLGPLAKPGGSRRAARRASNLISDPLTQASVDPSRHGVRSVAAGAS